MKKLFAFLNVLLLAAVSVWADDVPYRQQRRDHFSQLPIDNQTTVFLGNSITNFGVWPEIFAGNDTKVVNRGISGNFSKEVMAHFNWVIDAQPKAVYLMIGINDFSSQLDIVPSVECMIQIAKEVSPATKMYIESILPTNYTSGGDRRPIPTTYNPQLRSICDQYANATYVDVYTKMAEAGVANVMDDNLHPNWKGYQIWAKQVQEQTGLTTRMDLTSTYTNCAGKVFVDRMLGQYFLLPVESTDILMLGDGLVQQGEWRELFQGDTKIKNRGMGLNANNTYGLTADKLATVVEKVLHGGATPAKIFLHVGAADAIAGTAAATIVTNIQTGVNKIKELSPTTQIYLQSILPVRTATTNTNIITVANESLKTWCDETEGVEYINLYDSFVADGVLAPKYQSSYSGGNGANIALYRKWANLIKTQVGLTPLTELAENYHSIKPSTASETHWYTITANGRYGGGPMRYITSTGAGAGLMGEEFSGKANQQWKFVANGSGYDIINRQTGEYIDPSSAANNNQLKTSATQPSAAWTIGDAGANQMVYIGSGSAQLHQTNSSLSHKIYNWGGGSKTDDTGCLFYVEEAGYTLADAPALETIEYLIVFDQGAKAWCTNNGKTMQAHADDIIASLNQCMVNSHINGHFHLAGIMEVSETYNETSTGLNCGTSLAVKLKKAELSADMVCVLIEHDESNSVTGSSIPATTSDRADNAVCCVRCSQAVTGFVAAHETAHVMGGGHSLAMGDPGTAPAVACERTNGGKNYCTLLSDIHPEGHLLMLSGPGNYTANGSVEMGSDSENNAGVVRANWPTVAAFSESNASYTLSATTVEVAAAGVTNHTITATPASASINIVENCDWLTAYTEKDEKGGLYTNGSCSDGIHIDVEANTSEEARTATIIIHAYGYNPATITVNQAGTSTEPEPVTYEGEWMIKVDATHYAKSAKQNTQWSTELSSQETYDIFEIEGTSEACTIKLKGRTNNIGHDASLKMFVDQTVSTNYQIVDAGNGKVKIKNDGYWIYVDNGTFTWNTTNFTELTLVPNRPVAPVMPETTLTAKEITEEGWYILQYQKPEGTNFFCTEGQFLTGYETSPNWTSSFIPLVYAQDMTDSNFGQSLFYISGIQTKANNGGKLYLQSPNGHYMDGVSSLGSSVRNAAFVFMGWETANTAEGKCNVYIRNQNNGSNLAAMTYNKVNAFGGTSTGGNLAFFHVVKVDPAECGVTPWNVTIEGAADASVVRNDTQITYSGEGNVGLTKVYNHGTFFIDKNVTPTKDNFSAPDITGMKKTVTVNQTTHTVTVTYAVPGETVTYTLNTSHEDLSHLMPQPRSVNKTGSSCTLSGGIKVTVSGLKDVKPQAVSRFISEAGCTEGEGINLNIKYVGEITGTEDYTVAGFENEAYAIKIDGTDITVSAMDTTGVVRAMQTLGQMATESNTLTGCEIVDWPAFKIRGLMHDIGRSYISVAELKKEIDLLSRFKENVFLWHLTDKHGFRFESKTYPQVNTNFSSTRSAKFYTQAECKEVMNYARERGMMVIPEIDMPGHSARFQGAMGYTMASDEGKVALKAILDEVAATFEYCPYIHIGGDETNEATTDYINEMADYIHNNLGRKVVVWNQYGGNSNRQSVNPSTLHVDMSTNWATSGVVSSGIPNIDMRYNYINHFDMFGDLAGIYRSNIFGVQKGNADIAGSITGIWNDRVLNTDNDDEQLIVKENNLYANALATAERGWKGGGLHYTSDAEGGAYLPNSGSEYEEFKSWETRFLHHKATTLKSEEALIPFVKETHMRWNLTKAYDNGGDGGKVFDIESQTDLTPQPGDITITGAGAWLNHIWAGTVGGVLGKTAQSTNQTRYAWTYVYSENAQTVYANIQTYDYSRSQMGTAPENGKWDRMGSQVWINGDEIVPNVNWTTAGAGEENALGNVNFTTRKPIAVNLKKGWNKVLLKLPFINNTVGYYKNKWQFTFFFSDKDGINAVDGLIYNQNQSMDDEFEEKIPTPPFVVEPGKVYTMKCNRGSRYVTAAGKETTVTGQTSLATDGSAYWYFQPREDGKYDLVNYLHGGMIKGDGVASGSAMSTSATQPATGWEVQASSVDAWSVIVGGSNQFNQQNSGAYNILNWGGGSNKNDLGCLYQIEEVTSLPITITEAGYATFSYVSDIESTGGLQVYAVTAANNTYVHLESLSGGIPAETGVILKGSAGTYTLTVGTTSTQVENNLLKPALVSTTITPTSGYNAYIFAKPENKEVGFYKMSSSNLIGPRKCWLEVPTNLSVAQFLAFNFGEEATGVSELEAEGSPSTPLGKQADGKYLENHRLFIVKNGTHYNTIGQQIKQ